MSKIDKTDNTTECEIVSSIPADPNKVSVSASDCISFLLSFRWTQEVDSRSSHISVPSLLSSESKQWASKSAQLFSLHFVIIQGFATSHSSKGKVLDAA